MVWLGNISLRRKEKENENVSFLNVDQDETAETPTIEKHLIDAKAYILAATTKDGVNL